MVECSCVSSAIRSERERNGGLDILVAVNRRRDGLDDALPDTLVPCHVPDFALILDCEPERGEQVLLFVDVVGLDDRGEDREAVLRVERGVEVVAVDACDFLFANVRTRRYIPKESNVRSLLQV